MRHARQLRNLNSIALVRLTWNDLSEEHDLRALFPDGHRVVLDSLERLRQLCQLMIVGGEERLPTDLGMIVQMFGHGPRDGESVEGARAPSHLVKEHEAALG